MNAIDYLDDPEFQAFCNCWIGDGRCPFPLSDWLRDRGLDSQADGADWATNEPDRGDLNCSADGSGGVRPIVGNGWLLASWMEGSRFRSGLPTKVYKAFGDLVEGLDGPYSPYEAIGYFLDGWAAAVRSGWVPEQTKPTPTSLL